MVIHNGFKGRVADPTKPLPKQQWEQFAQLCLTRAQVDAYIEAYRFAERGKDCTTPARRMVIGSMATRLAERIRPRIDYLRTLSTASVVESSALKLSKLTVDEVANRLGAIATAELPGIVAWDKGGGHVALTLADYEGLTSQQRAAIKSIKVGPDRDGKQMVEIVLHDPIKAMELIGRHLGMFRDSLASVGTMQVNINLGGGGGAGQAEAQSGIIDVGDQT